MKGSITELVSEEINLIHGGVRRGILTISIVGFFIGRAIDYGKDTVSDGYLKRVIEVIEDLTLPVILLSAAISIFSHLTGRAGRGSKGSGRSF